MTHPDENPRDESGPARPDGAGLPLDEEAAWRSIVEHYGDRPVLGDEPAEAAEPAEPAHDEPTPSVFDRTFLDAQETQRRREPTADGWTDEGHFVPPEPPPIPRGTPARRLAWLGLFGTPVVMLAAVVFGWRIPGWLALLMVVAFIGGFVFLVATMPRDRDDWPGDDGAVV